MDHLFGFGREVSLDWSGRLVAEIDAALATNKALADGLTELLEA